MNSRISKSVMAMCALALVWAMSPTVSRAQEKTEKATVYTYVAEWDAPRAQWPDIEKVYTNEKDAMDKMVADGTIVGYGSYITVVHEMDASTHGSWFQATSMANLMKALWVIRSSAATSAPVFSASKHWDFILESKQYGYQSGTFTDSYLRVSTWTVKPGMGEEVEKFNKDFLVPILDKLVADGSLRGYQIDDQSIHSENPYMFNMAILTNGADGIDKFYAALDEAYKKNGFAPMLYGQSVDYSQHRDFLAFVPSFTHK
jgi:hypothetical protein